MHDLTTINTNCLVLTILHGFALKLHMLHHRASRKSLILEKKSRVGDFNGRKKAKCRGIIWKYEKHNMRKWQSWERLSHWFKSLQQSTLSFQLLFVHCGLSSGRKKDQAQHQKTENKVLRRCCQKKKTLLLNNRLYQLTTECYQLAAQF